MRMGVRMGDGGANAQEKKINENLGSNVCVCISSMDARTHGPSRTWFLFVYM